MYSGIAFGLRDLLKRKSDAICCVSETKSCFTNLPLLFITLSYTVCFIILSHLEWRFSNADAASLRECVPPIAWCI